MAKVKSKAAGAKLHPKGRRVVVKVKTLRGEDELDVSSFDSPARETVAGLRPGTVELGGDFDPSPHATLLLEQATLSEDGQSMDIKARLKEPGDLDDLLALQRRAAMEDRSLDMVEAEVEVTGQSALALRVIQEDMALDAWLPKSQLSFRPGERMPEPDQFAALRMPRWLAERAGLAFDELPMKRLADEMAAKRIVDKLADARGARKFRGVESCPCGGVGGGHMPGCVVARLSGPFPPKPAFPVELTSTASAGRTPAEQAREYAKSFSFGGRSMHRGVIDEPRDMDEALERQRKVDDEVKGAMGLLPGQCAVCKAPQGTPCTESCDDDRVPDELVKRFGHSDVSPEERDRMERAAYARDLERGQPSACATLPARPPKRGVAIDDEATLADLLCAEVEP